MINHDSLMIANNSSAAKFMELSSYWHFNVKLIDDFVTSIVLSFCVHITVLERKRFWLCSCMYKWRKNGIDFPTKVKSVVDKRPLLTMYWMK